ncbi:MAG: sialate O-acetylesterase [Muribaculaceae bacterium]|nr:sialate O-acetylesterase [Muribaculaceae bacterium]
MKKTILAAAALAAAATATAEIQLPEIVGDNMVLQQQTDARIWGWATPGSKIEARASWMPADATVSATAGTDSLWTLTLPTGAAGYEPQSIDISGDGSQLHIDNVLIGEVWFCSGQSNMEMPLRGYFTQPVEDGGRTIAYSGKYPGVRVVTVPKRGSYTPQQRAGGQWKESKPQNAGEFSALAYHFAQSLNDILDVPVGIISCAYGGSRLESWLPKEILDTMNGEDMDGERDGTVAVDDWHRIGVRYNAMLLPVSRYTVRGFLWNQGESNVGKHEELPKRQKTMVEHWRKLWGLGELPFYFVEIPGWEYGNPDGDWAAMFREAQHRAAAITPNSAIVCTSDLVYPYEVKDIHARRKREIGERMSWIAAANAYEIEGLPVEYPRFKEMDVDGDKATLRFSGADSGFTPNQYLEGFEACGADGVWHPAEAFEGLDSRDIHICCPEAGEIKEVRYCFKNFAVGKVHNMMGLPLIPFRSSEATPLPSAFGGKRPPVKRK